MANYLEFPYQPKIHILLLASTLFAACGLLFVHMAMTNDRGLTIDAVIELSADHATWFYWTLAALSGGFVVLGVLGLAERLFSPEKPLLRLTPGDITIPPFLFRREARTILFREITSLTRQEVNGQVFLTIRYGDRKKAGVTKSWLPDAAAFEAVCGFVMQHVNIYSS